MSGFFLSKMGSFLISGLFIMEKFITLTQAQHRLNICYTTLIKRYKLYRFEFYKQGKRKMCRLSDVLELKALYTEPYLNFTTNLKRYNDNIC